jgi:hypothetical protein
MLDKEDRNEFLKSAHLHPTSKFPYQHETGLVWLLRKKLEPEVIAWVKEGRVAGDAAMGKDEINFEELWDWARGASKIPKESNDADGESEAEEAEGDAMNTAEDKGKAVATGPASSLSQLLRYSVTGVQGRR